MTEKFTDKDGKNHQFFQVKRVLKEAYPICLCMFFKWQQYRLQRFLSEGKTAAIEFCISEPGVERQKAICRLS